MKIILGSASSRRKKILKNLGLDFEVRVANIDEKIIRHDDARMLPLLVAKAKALAILPTLTEAAVLITCDTVVIYNGILREKPETERQARDFLSSYGDKPIEVICGLYVTNTATGKSAGEIDSAKVYFHKLSPEAIDNIINFAPIFEWSGAFHADHPTVKPHIAYIEGEESTVMGLPILLLKKLMAEVTDAK